MAVSQSMDLAIALCKNLVNHLLESITAYSLTIFFTSIKLARDLLREKTYMCGTIRSNRQGFPGGLSLQKAKVKPYEKVNQSFIALETWLHQFGKTQS